MRNQRRSSGQKIKRMLSFLVCLTACPTVLSAQESSVTLFRDGSVLVRRTIGQPLGAGGTTTLQLDLQAPAIDAGSFVVLDTTASLQSFRLLQADGLTAALRRAVGRDIDFWVAARDTLFTVRGRVLSADPFAVRVGSRVLYEPPGRPAFPDSLAPLSARAEVGVLGRLPTPALHVAYLTSGASWQATFTAVVSRQSGGTASVSGLATIANAGLRMHGVHVQLASGDIRRAGGPVFDGVRAMAAAPLARADLGGGESVADTRVYSLPGTLTFEPGVSVGVPLFDRTTADVERMMVFNPSGNVISQWVGRADSNVHPDIHYVIHRPAGSTFGDLPLPEGTLRVLVPDSAGRVQLVGEASLPPTPPGRDLDIVTGTASDVVADRIQTDFEPHGERDVTTAYRVTVHNGKDEPVTVAVNEFAPGHWEILTSSVQAERVSASQFRFTLPVAAHGDGVLEYRIHVRW